MSTYNHFFKNVSIKCRAILTDYRNTDVERDREVTHMMALANAAIGIPFERLVLSDVSGDKKSYPEAQNELNKFLNSGYSRLFQEGAWCYGRWDGKPLEWENKVTYCSKLVEEYFKESTDPPNVKYFLKHLRNAFAHGNLFFTPESGKIERIVFLQKDFTKQNIDDSAKRKCLEAIKELQGNDARALRKAIKDAALLAEGYAFLTVAPDDFMRFLDVWFAVIEGLEVAEGTLNDILGEEVALSEAAD